MRKKLLYTAVVMMVGLAFATNAQAWGWAGGTDPWNWTDAAAWSGGPGGDYPGHTENKGLQDAFGGWMGITTVDLTIDTVIPVALDGSWSNYGVVPDSDVTVTILPGGSLTELDVWIGRNNAKGHIDVNGGSFTVLSGPAFHIANSFDNDGTEGRLTVRGNGTVNAPTSTFLGNEPDHTAIITIEDGTMFTNSVAINNPGDKQHIMFNTLGGILRLDGDQIGNVDALLANTGMRYTTPDLDIKYVADGDYTQVEAIPEPGTVMLLGLAGLAMFIRRRFVK